jgi:hypothetical protein
MVQRLFADVIHDAIWFMNIHEQNHPWFLAMMITRPIWKCLCIKLFITDFRHLDKRHPYWPETKSRPILARANMGLDMEMIL